MIDRKLTAVLHADTDHVQVPDHLRDRIVREAAQPVRSSWWARWTRHRAVQIAVAALVMLPLLGFTGRQIWVVHAKYPPSAPPVHRLVREEPIAQMTSDVDFKIKLPSYLPDGMALFASVLAGDSTKPDAALRVAEVAYMKQGLGSITVEQWRAEKATPFAPGDPFPAVLDTEPWHKTLKPGSANINGIDAQTLTYLISGIEMNRVFWHEKGIDYAVAADANLPVSELLKVARSLR